MDNKENKKDNDRKLAAMTGQAEDSKLTLRRNPRKNTTAVSTGVTLDVKQSTNTYLSYPHQQTSS